MKKRELRKALRASRRASRDLNDECNKMSILLVRYERETIAARKENLQLVTQEKALLAELSGLRADLHHARTQCANLKSRIRDEGREKQLKAAKGKRKKGS